MVIAESITTSNELETFVSQAAAGNTDAFHWLYEKYKDEFYRMSLVICRDEFIAEEAVQESFIRMLRKLNRLREPAKFKAWSYRIVINSSYSVLKKHRRDWIELNESIPDEDSVSSDSAVVWKQLSKALVQLPKGYRNVFILHYLQELPHEQVAAILNISVGTSKSQYHRARGQLRQLLTEQGIKYE